MSVKELAFELEELQVKAEKVDGLQDVLFRALDKKDWNQEAYEWAFMVLGELTLDLKKELNIMVNKLLAL
jgi:hypothetical protein